MPAYSFQLMFVTPIEVGTKGGTIRAPRRAGNSGIHSTARQAIGGHAYPDEVISLYCQQRSPGGFLIARKKCLATEPIELSFNRHVVTLSQRKFRKAADLDLFARFDGFDGWEQQREFWYRTHGPEDFRGWHIRWQPLPLVDEQRSMSV